MKTKLCLAVILAVPLTLTAANNQLLSWNNLGMHCMDSDYSVFSVLPPYNTIEAQLIVGGKLVTNGVGYSVSYQAVADPDGSFNSTAMGKGNYYTFATTLYGAVLAPEAGLAGWSMPGTNNVPQSMLFEQTNRPAPGVATRVNWFRAEGIPVAPYDDVGLKNPYPMMRLIARNNVGTPIATNDVVLPVSDEMDCRTCHGSGTQLAAKPAAGWVWSDNPERDFRLNILRLHDEKQFADHAGLYVAALAARGFNPQGLYRGVVADNKPVLCAICHASEALGTGSYSNTPPLTASVHAQHAGVMDPDLQLTLDNSSHRAACYRCHPGSTTKCLRGAMGGAIARDGSLEMQCQSCHGSMSQVGSLNRVGWFMEPNCQSCHSGTATSNNGQIRYTSVFETNGSVRVATNQTFATNPDNPAPGISLYRFSAGHGGLQCSACHGSTHAEFPATHRNDNVRNIALQGHVGMMIECTACHTTMPSTITGGPHGMHPVLQNWVNSHGDLMEFGAATRQQCRACHGLDYKGTVLSRHQGNHIITTDGHYGTLTYWRGRQIGCYDCHWGPNSTDPSSLFNSPPVVSDFATNTSSGAALSVQLPGLDADGDPLTFRIVSQPQHGSVGLSNRTATYYPDPGFVGIDAFSFAANDGYTDSNLRTGTVNIAQGPCSIAAKPCVPGNYPMGWPVSFGATATLSNVLGAACYVWDFGDGCALETNQFVTHGYTNYGSYTWKLICSVAMGATSVAVTNSGNINVGPEQTLRVARAPDHLLFSWPRYEGDALLEWSPVLGPAASWSVDTNWVNYATPNVTVQQPNAGANRFYRLRKL